MAIARYAAKLAKLYPADPVQALFVDEVVETVVDIVSGIPRHADAEIVKKMREEFITGKGKLFFTFLAEKLQASTGPFVFGSDFCLADICLYQVLGFFRKGVLDHIPIDYDAQWPIFDSFVKNYEGHPVLGQYKI